MNQSHKFVIRRTFVVPMGLLILLTMVLLVVCLVQGQPVAKIVILAVLLVPMLVLFVETAFRSLVVEQKRIKAYRPFRQRQICFESVTSLETVQVRNRVFMTLSAGPDEFLIISNSYNDFPALVKNLIALVPDGTVTEETQKLAQQPPRRQADVFTVWFAVIALVYVLIAQFQ